MRFLRFVVVHVGATAAAVVVVVVADAAAAPCVCVCVCLCVCSFALGLPANVRGSLIHEATVRAKALLATPQAASPSLTVDVTINVPFKYTQGEDATQVGACAGRPA